MTTLHLKCPVCETETERDYINLLNTAKHPELVRDLQEGKLFEFECDHCGAKRQLSYQFLYHDPAKHFMVFLLPEYRDDQEQVEQALTDLLTEIDFSLANYQLRIAVSVPELIEKVLIFNTGYDDRVVETVKILTDGLFAQDKPTLPVKARYFYLQDNKPKVLYLTDEGQILADFHEKLVDFVRVKYAKKLDENLKGEFHHINFKWAFDLLES